MIIVLSVYFKLLQTIEDFYLWVIDLYHVTKMSHVTSILVTVTKRIKANQ